MHHYSQYISRTFHRYAILIGLVYVLMHGYALYISTYHLFHGMPPMCQLCAATKSYQSSIVNTVTPVFELIKAAYIYTEFRPHINRIVTPFFQPRAPPQRPPAVSQ